MHANLKILASRPSGDTIACSAVFQSPDMQESTFCMQVPASHRPLIGNTPNAFLILSVFAAMRRGGTLHVDAPVCPLLKARLMEFTRAWSQWVPERYKPLEITSTAEADSQPCPAGKLLVPFSGGLDSCHNIWNLLGDGPGENGRKTNRGAISAVLVHGFDIPLEDEAAFSIAESGARKILSDVGVELITMRCNIRQFPHDWDYEHGAAIAACLHLLDGGFSKGAIAGSHSYRTLRFPWGSNPVTDPMLSSNSMTMRYEGLAYARNDKAKAIASWPVAMQELRSCWQPGSGGNNCGRCVTCISTALCFAAEGVKPPATFPIGSPREAVAALDKLKLSSVHLTRLEDSVLAPARRNDIVEPWVDLLARMIRRKRRRIQRKELRRALRRFFKDTFPSVRNSN